MPNFTVTEAVEGLPQEWTGLLRFIRSSGFRNASAFRNIKRDSPSFDEFCTFLDNTFLFYLATSTNESSNTLVNRVYIKYQDLLLAMNRLDQTAMAVVRQAESAEWKAEAMRRVDTMRSEGYAPFTIIRVGEAKEANPPIINLKPMTQEEIDHLKRMWNDQENLGIKPSELKLVPLTEAVYNGSFGDGVWNKLLEIIDPKAETFRKDDVFRAYRMFRGGNVRVGKHARHRILNGFLSTWSKNGKIQKLGRGLYQIVDRLPVADEEDDCCPFDGET